MKMTVERPSQQQLTELDVSSWDIWTCEPSTFPWTYSDREVCYILEGDVTVTAAGQTITFGAGDLVTFPKGLSCTWEVRQPVRKHYRFG